MTPERGDVVRPEPDDREPGRDAGDADRADVERRNFRRWAAALAVLALLVAGVRIASAALDPGRPGQREIKLAVLDRPATAADREAAKSFIVELTKDERSKDESAAVVRMLSDEGDRKVILIASSAASDRGDRATEGPGSDDLCLYDITGPASVAPASSFCGSAEQLRRGEIGGVSEPPLQAGDEITEEGKADPRQLLRELESGKGRAAGPTHFFGLVPDGVERVRVSFSGGLPDLEATVKDNFYDATSRHPRASDYVGPETWFDGDGQVVRH